MVLKKIHLPNFITSRRASGSIRRLLRWPGRNQRNMISCATAPSTLPQTSAQGMPLASVRIDDAWLDRYLDAMIGNPEKVPDGRARTMMENRIKLIESRLAFGKGVDLPGVAGTAWHALNAMIEFADYDMKAKGQESDPSKRTQNVLFGRAAEFKQKAFDTVMALTA